jgi:hypothetical protein
VLIQQRYPDWVEANRMNRKEATLSDREGMLITFAASEWAPYNATEGEKNL